MRAPLLVLVVLLAGLAAAAPASAATVGRTGDVVGFTAVAGDKVDLAVRAGNSSIRSLVFANAAGATPFTVAPGCSR